MAGIWPHSGKISIAGIGATPYYGRGESWPQTIHEMAGRAILAAVADAGLKVSDIDGFAYYSGGGGGYGETLSTEYLMDTLGIPEVTYTAALTGGGGGSAGVIGLAASAILSGMANTVVTVMALQQAKHRLGGVFAAMPPTPDNSFVRPSGLAGPGNLMSVLAKRHMHLYGTRREAFAEIAISSRLNAMNREGARMRTPLTLEDYFAAPMISDPLCLYDFCLETDGAVAFITTTTERAQDLRQPPVKLLGSELGGHRDWGRAFTAFNMSDDLFASSGNRSIARRLYAKTGLGPADVDVALIYDHFTPMVVMQLEDYGFCDIGEGGAFVESGAIRVDGGSLPMNPHGGQLSEAYVIGSTHIREAVEQLRGCAVNQVKDAEIALVTGGPASLPVSGILLGK